MPPFLQGEDDGQLNRKFGDLPVQRLLGGLLLRNAFDFSRKEFT
jgi:hypothetical protein